MYLAAWTSFRSLYSILRLHFRNIHRLIAFFVSVRQLWLLAREMVSVGVLNKQKLLLIRSALTVQSTSKGPKIGPSRSFIELCELAREFNRLHREEQVPSRGAYNDWLISIRNVRLYDEPEPSEGSCRILFLCTPTSSYVFSSRILPPYSGQAAAEIDELVYQLLSQFTLRNCMQPIPNIRAGFAPWSWSTNDADLGRRLCARLKEVGVDEPHLLTMEAPPTSDVQRSNRAWDFWWDLTKRAWTKEGETTTYRQCYNVGCHHINGLTEKDVDVLNRQWPIAFAPRFIQDAYTDSKLSPMIIQTSKLGFPGLVPSTPLSCKHVENRPNYNTEGACSNKSCWSTCIAVSF